MNYFWLQFLWGVALSIGFFLFIIPAFLFYIWFLFAKYIWVAENVTGLSPFGKDSVFGRSKEYVRGYFWPIVGRLLLILVLTMGVSFLSDLFLEISLLKFMIDLTIGFFLSPYIETYIYILYKHTRAIKST